MLGYYIIIIYNPHLIAYFQISNEKYVSVGFVLIDEYVSKNVRTLNVYTNSMSRYMYIVLTL